MEWFEAKLNAKYDISLQGLKLRFLTFYNIIKAMLDYLLELHDALGANLERSSEHVNIRALLDNCMNILKMIITEYPNCLDLEFCESYLASVTERIDLFQANFHPLTHIETNNATINRT
jgi:hypothetical protein